MALVFTFSGSGLDGEEAPESIGTGAPDMEQQVAQELNESRHGSVRN